MDILSLYDSLHEAGVVHNDVESRHWLRHPDGSIRIIDFDSAISIDGNASGRKWGELVKSEIQQVRDRLRL